jgi:glycosyltransferase involved in cell wall biosynthesis
MPWVHGGERETRSVVPGPTATPRPAVDTAVRVARHYGPATGFAGGMAAVLEAVLELPLRRYRAELVATWTPEARWWGAALVARALWGLLRGRDRPVIHVHLSVGGSFLREGAIVAVARARRLPVVVSLHGGELPEFAQRHPRLVRSVLGRADAVVALGPHSADQAAGWAPATTRIEVIPNPVELTATTPAAGTDEEVVFAGTLSYLKGVDVLLAAWPAVRARRPEARLILAGPPGDIDVAASAGDGIAVPGTMTREEVRRFLHDCRVAVLPSRVEVLPMFLLEAMASARPVVATPVGDVAWLVGGDGHVVPVGDSEALAGAITEMLEDPAAAGATGERLRARAERDFAPATVASQLETLYDVAIEHAGAR